MLKKEKTWYSRVLVFSSYVWITPAWDSMGGQQGSKRPGGLQLRGVVGQGKAMLLIALWECREKVQREGTVSISRCSEFSY